MKRFIVIAAGFFLIAFNFILTPLGLYVRFWWLDIVMHFLGGFITAAFFLFFVPDCAKLPRRLFFIFIVGGTAIVGIFWELFEWAVDSFFIPNFMGDRNDTLLDLAMDLSAGVFLALLTKIRSLISNGSSENINPL